MKKKLLFFVCALMILGCKKQEAGNVEAVPVETEEKSENAAIEAQPVEETEDLGDSWFYLTKEYIGIHKDYLLAIGGALSDGYIDSNTIVEVFPEKEKDNNGEKWLCLRRIDDKDIYYTREIEPNGRENFINLNTQNIDEARQASFDSCEGYPNEFGLPDGQYFVKKLILHSPQYKWLKPSDFLKTTLLIKDNKAYVSNKNFTEIYTAFRLYDLSEMSLDNFYFSEALFQKVPSSGECLCGGGDASGGGVGFVIFSDGDEFKAICGGNNFAFQEEFTCIFGTENVEPEIAYDMQFPFYGLFEYGCKAYTTQDFDKEPDFEISANTIEFTDYYYEFTETNEQHLVLLKQLVSNEKGNFYECEYLDHAYWINEKNLPPVSIYTSIDAVRKAVGFKNGL